MHVYGAAVNALRAGDVETGVARLHEAASAWRSTAPKAAGMIGAQDLKGKLLDTADKVDALAQALATGATSVPTRLVSEVNDAVSDLEQAHPVFNPNVHPC